MGLLLVKGVLFLAAPVRLSWRNYSAAGGLISRGTYSSILPGECGSSLPFECQSRNGMLAGKLPPCFSRRLLRVPCLVRCPFSSVRPVLGGREPDLGSLGATRLVLARSAVGSR